MITLTATIASGNNKSHALYLGTRSVIGVHLPTVPDDTAIVSFEVSDGSGSGWKPLQDSASLIVLPANPQHAVLPAELTQPWQFIRLVAGDPDHLVVMSSDVQYELTLI
ncbi:MAG: hypothetical protein GF393_12780 [Armatimonadia bacterium]|nr:hypothetical protein [Armatimonadia bacterium]